MSQIYGRSLKKVYIAVKGFLGFQKPHSMFYPIIRLPTFAPFPFFKFLSPVNNFKEDDLNFAYFTISVKEHEN